MVRFACKLHLVLLVSLLPSIGVAQEEAEFHVTAPPKVPTLPHRWEWEPDLDVNWAMSVVADPLEIVEAALIETDERQCLRTLRRLDRVGARGLANGDEIFDALRKRAAQPECSLSLKLALLSSALQVHRDDKRLESLWEVAKGQPNTQRLIERALAESQCSAALEVWRNRLDSNSGNLAEKVIALRGIGQTGDSGDQNRLRAFVQNPLVPLPAQIAASKSLGKLFTSGLEELAGAILAAKREHAPLLAAYMLSSHTTISQATQDAIFESNSQPAHRVLFANCVRFRPEDAARVLETFLQHPDPAARQSALRFSVKHDAAQSISKLQNALSDPNYATRTLARNLLLELSQNTDSRKAVSEATRQTLASGNLLGKEQACILAGEAKFPVLCRQLVSFLSSPEARISVNAAWALQIIASDTSILEEVEDYVRKATDSHFKAKKWMSENESVKVGYLIEALGNNDIQSIEDLLKLYIPKEGAPEVARASAIWTLGVLKANSGDKQLSKKLAARLHDDSDVFPEYLTVKYVSALSLGRIRADGNLGEVERHYDRPPFPIGLARKWAMERLAAPSDSEK